MLLNSLAPHGDDAIPSSGVRVRCQVGEEGFEALKNESMVSFHIANQIPLLRKVFAVAKGHLRKS